MQEVHTLLGLHAVDDGHDIREVELRRALPYCRRGPDEVDADSRSRKRSGVDEIGETEQQRLRAPFLVDGSRVRQREGVTIASTGVDGSAVEVRRIIAVENDRGLAREERIALMHVRLHPVAGEDD